MVLNRKFSQLYSQYPVRARGSDGVGCPLYLECVLGGIEYDCLQVAMFHQLYLFFISYTCFSSVIPVFPGLDI